ncbi:MAG: peptide chain release factor-like protein [Candidatus Omnitrophica bacterium]|nr:peptide chain release factor-like protein [Candidatus Omnitrophota bacterium]
MLDLKKEMLRLGIRDEDIIENFVRSSGPGGQNVNKTSTCVYLKHIPTGIEVKCQRERSQAANRYLARRILITKVNKLFSERLFEEKQRKAKQLRKSRRRPKGLKERILEEKRRRSRKKSLRGPVRDIEE